MDKLVDYDKEEGRGEALSVLPRSQIDPCAEM